MTRSRINRNSFEPAYSQIVAILREQIADGVFRAGDRLPSESQLCKEYKVSPMTVRRAVNALLEQGVVHTVQGLGTFVNPLQLSTVTFGLDQFQRLFSDGADTHITILEAGIVRADDLISEKLEIAPGTRAILIRRRISKGSEPWIYHREYLIYDPQRPVVEAEMEVASLHGLFYGGEVSSLKWGSLTISTVTMNEEEAQVLDARIGGPAFNLEHLFHDFDDHPVSWGGFLCRGDRFKFNAMIGHFNSHGNIKDTGNER